MPAHEAVAEGAGPAGQDHQLPDGRPDLGQDVRGGAEERERLQYLCQVGLASKIEEECSIQLAFSVIYFFYTFLSARFYAIKS